MTIPHAFGFARDLYLNSPAETFALVCRHCPYLIHVVSHDRCRIGLFLRTQSKSSSVSGGKPQTLGAASSGGTIFISSDTCESSRTISVAPKLEGPAIATPWYGAFGSKTENTAPNAMA